MNISIRSKSLGERLEAHRTARGGFPAGGLFPARHLPYASTSVGIRKVSRGERDVPDTKHTLRVRIAWASSAASIVLAAILLMVS